MDPENTIINKLKNMIPDYAYRMFAVMITVNMFTYYGTRVITRNRYHYGVSTRIDEMLPFVAVFIIPYFLAYVQWLVGFVAASRVSRQHCYYILGGEIVTKIMVAVVFIVFPTSMVRAEIVSNDIFSRLVQFLYSVDTPDNLFPSLHCVESWLCMRGCLGQKSMRKPFRVGMCIATATIFISTLLVKQHVVFDLFGAVVLSEMGLFISRTVIRKRQ